MSDEEHLVENIVSYVQSVGWIEAENSDFDDVYERYGSNGNLRTDKQTFRMLLNMAIYVVYQATVCGTDFSENKVSAD